MWMSELYWKFCFVSILCQVLGCPGKDVHLEQNGEFCDRWAASIFFQKNFITLLNYINVINDEIMCISDVNKTWKTRNLLIRTF